MKVPFDVRSVTLQLEGDPKAQVGAQSNIFYYFQEAFGPLRLFKPFCLLPEHLLTPLQQIKPCQGCNASIRR